MIFYKSTNRLISLLDDEVNFETALFRGIAPDEGLYMPTRIPKFTFKEIMDMENSSYSDIAFKVLNVFLKNQISEQHLKFIVRDSYNFEVPIEKLNHNTSIVRLDRGPTLSFKDFAGRFMARVMKVLKKDDEKITILVATSGDTGGAMGSSFKGLDNIEVVILYPKDEVTDFQKKQMNDLGCNVKTIEVNGKFDDCQLMVKKAFNDSDLIKLNLTSANSINIGRILPQIVYYFYTFLKCSSDYLPLIFSVPSGNFGNSLGCEIARRMGLPVKKIILAVNENDEFPKFLKKGYYHKISPSIACLSNAMNVGNPSNLARYFDLYGGSIDKNGLVNKMPDLEEMRKNIYSASVSDEETIKTMQDLFLQKKIIVEPHGAVGLKALEKYRTKTNDDYNAIVLETAAPEKFSDSVESILNISLNLNKISVSKANCLVENDYNDFKSKLLDLQNK